MTNLQKQESLLTLRLLCSLASLSPCTWAGPHTSLLHILTTFIPPRAPTVAAPTSTPDAALTAGARHLLPRHRRSFLSCLYLIFSPFSWPNLLPVFSLTNLKTIFPQVSVWLCFSALLATSGGKNRERTQERTLERSIKREAGDEGLPKTRGDTTVPRAHAQGQPCSSLHGANGTLRRSQTLPLLSISSLTHSFFLFLLKAPLAYSSFLL